MARAPVAIACALIALCLGTAAATTKGTRFEGYTYASDVTGYVNMTIDYCDMVAAVKAGDYATALDIYSNGKNSFSGAVKRTFYRFASHVPTASEPLYDALTIGRNGSWLDDAIKAAFAAENGALALGLVQVATIKYYVHEVDEGANKVAAYVADKVNLTINIDDDRGAPHNVDEAFALFAGGRRPNCGTVSSWASSLGNAMDTTLAGSAHLRNHMTLAINDLLAQARAGNSVAYNATRNAQPIALRLLGLQGVMRGAYRARLAANCRRPAADIADAKTEIAVHWTYLRPLLVSYQGAGSAWTMRINALQTALTAANPSWPAVKTAVVNVLASMNRRLHEVGAPNFSAINGGWKCPMTAKP